MAARLTCTCGWTRTYDSPAVAEYNARRHRCPTSRGIRRATRRHRCARCGLEQTYDNAGAAEARYWFAKHSCRRQETKMLKASQAQLREALIDRTPQPCHHKVANHQHGTRACYVLDRCRCEPCSTANAAAETWRQRQKAYGRYNRYLPAGPVRNHTRELMASGIGLKQIVKVTGVSSGTLWKLLYGKRRPDGTRQPSRRILRTTAEKLYALDPAWTDGPLPYADGALVPAHGTVLRMRALVALGWSQSQLADRLGIHRANFRLATGCWQITARTARHARTLYDQLSMTLPPTDTRWQRAAVARAKAYAADRDWLPPLALDDDRLDDTGYEPWFETPNEPAEAAS